MPKKSSKNYGLKIPKIEPNDYLGGVFSLLPKEVLQPDGQWDDYLPLPEHQSLGVETMACTAFGTLSACEMIAKRKYQDNENWSDRWLAWNADVSPQGQNPHHTAEVLRKSGSPDQRRWDYTEDIKSWDDFYETPPPKLFDYARSDFQEQYNFKHEYISPDAVSLKEALKLSPLGVAVTAWYERGRSGIYEDRDQRNNHWCVLYGYDDNLEAWKVFDSYDNYVKLYSYDSLISVAKRFWIEKRPPKESWWSRLLQWFNSWF